MKRPLYSRTGSTRTGSTRTGSSGTGYKTGSTIVNGGTVRGGNTPITRQNTIDDLYSDILKHNAGGDSLNQLLAMLGIEQEKGLSPGQRDDWNKQLLDAQLQHYMDLEKRQYTAETLGEQRLYDSPTNQLARLMGAGISRDAAISMLQGGQQATLAESAVSPTGISASESKANGVNNALGIASAVINGVSAVSGLVNLGFSIPQSILQTQFLKYQNLLTSDQIAGYKIANKAFGILNSIGAGADAFGSASGAIAAIQDAAKSGNADAVSFVASGGLESLRDNANFASNTLSTLYQSENSARAYKAAVGKSEAEEQAAKVQVDILSQEVQNLEAEYQKICSETAYTDALAAACNKQAKVFEEQADLLRKQGKTEDAKYFATLAQGLYTHEQTRALDMENDVQEAFLNSSLRDSLNLDDPNAVLDATGLDWMTLSNLDQTVFNARIAAKTTNPAYVNQTYLEMFNTKQSIAFALALDAMQTQQGLKFAQDYPSHFAMWSAYKRLGAYDWLQSENESNMVQINRFNSVSNALKQK